MSWLHMSWSHIYHNIICHDNKCHDIICHDIICLDVICYDVTCHDIISAATESGKTRKSLKKNIYNLERKIENLSNKVESLQTSKKRIRIERDKLEKELKKIQKHSKPLIVTKSLTTQTDPLCDNNMQNFLLNIKTIRSSINETSKSFNCFVCNEVFNEKSYLQVQADDKHEIELDSDTLLDFNPIQGGVLTIQGGGQKRLRYIFWPYLSYFKSD